MVGIDVVDVKIRLLLDLVCRALAGRAPGSQPAVRRQRSLFRQSQQNSLAGVTAPSSAAAIDTRFQFRSTASVVAPWRSRANDDGICSADRPRLADLPPLLRDFRGMSDRLPLNDSRMKVSSPSTIPVKVLGLSPASEARNLWSPAKRRGVMHAASASRFRGADAVDHGLGLRGPFVLHTQIRQRRFRQGVERAPTGFAAVARQIARPTPMHDVTVAAMRTPNAVHAALAQVRRHWPPPTGVAGARSDDGLPPAVRPPPGQNRQPGSEPSRCHGCPHPRIKPKPDKPAAVGVSVSAAIHQAKSQTLLGPWRTVPCRTEPAARLIADFNKQRDKSLYDDPRKLFGKCGFDAFVEETCQAPRITRRANGPRLCPWPLFPATHMIVISRA